MVRTVGATGRNCFQCKEAFPKKCTTHHPHTETGHLRPQRTPAGRPDVYQQDGREACPLEKELDDNPWLLHTLSWERTGSCDKTTAGNTSSERGKYPGCSRKRTFQNGTELTALKTKKESHRIIQGIVPLLNQMHNKITVHLVWHATTEENCWKQLRIFQEGNNQAGVTIAKRKLFFFLRNLLYAFSIFCLGFLCFIFAL